MLCPNCNFPYLTEIDNLHMIWKCNTCGFEADGGDPIPADTLIKVYPVVGGVGVFVAFGSIQDGTIEPGVINDLVLEIAEAWGHCMTSTQPIVGRELCR